MHSRKVAYNANTNSSCEFLPSTYVADLHKAALLLELQTARFETAFLAKHLERVIGIDSLRSESQPALLRELMTSYEGALTAMTRALELTTRPSVRIPTEILYQGWASLFPAERMAIISGRRSGCRIDFGATFDVTSVGPETNRVHVSADRDRLRQALLGLEHAGAHLAGWIHSHPGIGVRATEPSSVDRAQHADWVRDYGKDLISLIVVDDGVVRLWGTALEKQTVRVEIVGSGATPVPGQEHVFQLAR